MQQEQLASMEKQKQMDLQFRADEAEKDRQKDITVAEIRAAGYGSVVDIDQNQQSDFQDALKDIRQTEQYQQTMNFKREQEVNKTAINQQKLSLDREKMQAQKEIADKQLEIARENKNKYDVQKNNKKSK
jgi:hypothetical protein